MLYNVSGEGGRLRVGFASFDLSLLIPKDITSYFGVNKDLFDT